MIWIILGLNERMKVSETQLEELKRENAGNKMFLFYLNI